MVAEGTLRTDDTAATAAAVIAGRGVLGARGPEGAASCACLLKLDEGTALDVVLGRHLVQHRGLGLSVPLDKRWLAVHGGRLLRAVAPAGEVDGGRNLA